MRECGEHNQGWVCNRADDHAGPHRHRIGQVTCHEWANPDDAPHPDSRLPGDTAFEEYANNFADIHHYPRWVIHHAFAAGWDARRRFDEERDAM